jgi:Raf kinase inhibitor-like YbhB/YbcL family protein
MTRTCWPTKRRVALLVLALGASMTFGGAAMKLTSTAFSDYEAIPALYTCEGRNVSPPLQWSEAPISTKSLALIIDDPDAPDPRAPRTTWVHLLLYNIPPTVASLPEGIASDSVPTGSLFGVNDFRRADYGGPCPPAGRHRYFHKLYALDAVLPRLSRPTKAQLENAMQGHILAQATLVGTYEKRR